MNAVKRILLFSLLLVGANAFAQCNGEFQDQVPTGFKKAPDETHDANFIHAIWQETNSYRTRYKAMKNADKSAVTDIQSYIRSHNIPAEYQGYYQKNVSGFYEEDIKFIPNKWLAYSNAKENTQGSKSYVDNLILLTQLRPASLGQAVQAVIARLRSIHVEWYERNSDWTVPYGEPKTFEEAGIESQYNGAIQFYKLAEYYGVLENPIWKQAFRSLTDDLARQKMKPYQGLSAEGAYLAMTEKVGTRPSITGDAHLASFFSQKLPRYGFAFPAKRAEEPAAVLAFLQEQFPHINGVPASRFKILTPPVAPGSDARIYLIRDVQTTSGLVAVLKVQHGDEGLNEVVSTAAAEKSILSQQANFAPVKTFAYGGLGNNDYFILQEGAKTFEADKVFDLTGKAQRLWMVDKTAEALVQIHGPYRIFAPEELKGVSADLTTFKGNCFYDIRKMREQLLDGRSDAFTANVQDGAVSSIIARIISRKVSATTESYSRLVQVNPQWFSPAKTHGDFHGGNLFLNTENDGSMLIDYSGLTFFIGKKIGTGDRANDVGRMLGNILVEGTRHRLDFEREILPLMKKLLAEYEDKAGLSNIKSMVLSRSFESKIFNHPQEVYAFETAVTFYINRFIAINAADRAGKKFKPINETSLDLRERLFENWNRFFYLFEAD